VRSRPTEPAVTWRSGRPAPGSQPTGGTRRPLQPVRHVSSAIRVSLRFRATQPSQAAERRRLVQARTESLSSPVIEQGHLI